MIILRTEEAKTKYAIKRNDLKFLGFYFKTQNKQEIIHKIIQLVKEQITNSSISEKPKENSYLEKHKEVVEQIVLKPTTGFIFKEIAEITGVSEATVYNVKRLLTNSSPKTYNLDKMDFLLSFISDCEYCGKMFLKKRIDNVFCSDICRKKSHKDNSKG